jgi:hypothetical protein
MKKLLLISLVTGILFAACQDDETSRMPIIEQMKDSIFKAYPTVMQVTIKVGNDGKELEVLLGDKHLYNSSDDKLQQTATELGAMALRLFGKNNEFATGVLHVSSDEKNIDPDPAIIRIAPINIDSMKKATAK